MSDKPQGFSVIRRNYGHWDITNSKTRIFRIRGFQGKYLVIDERESQAQRLNMEFNTTSMCMTYICDELMFELTHVKGQESTLIDTNGNRVYT